MGYRNKLKNRIWKTVRALSIKRLLLMLFCLILLTAPTVLAIAYRHHVDTTSNIDVFKVTLYDDDGGIIGYDEGTPNSASADSLLWLFYHIPMEMKPLSSAPGDPESDARIYVETDLNGEKEKMTYYFSMVASASYCIDENGGIFAVPAQYNDAFLGTAYAESFYPAARVPQLITIDRDTILPTTVQWYYNNYNDVNLPAKQYETAKSPITYEMTGALGMSFSSEPDFCEAKIYENEILLYSGPLDQISSLTVDSGNEMKISVRAIWLQENHPEAHGEIFYEFPVRIRNRSEFSVSATSIPSGGFTTISGTNITNPSKIDFSSDMEGPTPVFHLDRSQMRAFLFIPPTTPAGTHWITLTYGASSQSFVIEVTDPRAVDSFDYSDRRLQSPSSGLQAAVTEWMELLKALPSPQPILYFPGNFEDPLQNGFRTGYTHGSRVQWINDIVPSVIGHEFVIDQTGGTAVHSLQSGKVIQIGSCALLGNYVVIDHGCGLRLWYGHLSSVDVEQGDVLSQGQSVGKAGTGGASTANGFLLVCTIYDNVIDPVLIFGQKIS